MYRIVIADDEEYIRELLAKHINQFKEGFEVVGKAENGAQAIGLVREHRPDILITDICMPLVDGLDLIKEVMAMGKPIKTIIISGHDDFSYAKKALTLGVTEYLLKPFLPEEIFKVLDKIQEELDRQKVLINNIQDMKAQIETNISFLQERFIQKIIQEPLYEDEACIEEGKRIRVDLEANYYCAGLIRILSNFHMDDFLYLVKDDYFDSGITTYTSSFNENQLTVVFCGNKKNPNSFCKGMKEGINRMNQSMEKYYNMHIWCALGTVYDNYRNISTSYNEALSVWKSSLNHTGCVVCYEDNKKQKSFVDSSDLQRPKELENSLFLHIQMGKKEQSLEILNEILAYYARFQADVSEFVMVSLVELVFSVSNLFIVSEENVQIWEDKNVIEYLKKHFSYGSLLDVKMILEEYISKCCEQFEGKNKRQGSKIIYNVKMLVEQNLDHEEFNLELASAKLFFSPNYVRKLFKQETGESFMEYLIRKRMERAAELLKNPMIKIQEVAVKTGYSNQRYFASCFKKYYGNTPTEYREHQHNVKQKE